MTRTFAIAAALAIALGFSSAVSVNAHGIRDQSHSEWLHIHPSWRGSGGSHYGCSGLVPGSVSVGQSFVPSHRKLVAVELRLFWEHDSGRGLPIPTGSEIQLDVRDGGPDAPVLASASLPLVAPDDVHDDFVAHFDLTPEVGGVKGRTLFLQLTVPVPPHADRPVIGPHISSGDLYGAGRAWGCFGNPAPPDVVDEGSDFWFSTYSEGGDTAQVCPQIAGAVPPAVINAAMANPDQIGGYDELEYPHRTEGPRNRPRTWLTLRSPGVPYHPMFNGLVWRAGCP